MVTLLVIKAYDRRPSTCQYKQGPQGRRMSRHGEDPGSTVEETARHSVIQHDSLHKEQRKRHQRVMWLRAACIVSGRESEMFQTVIITFPTNYPTSGFRSTLSVLVFAELLSDRPRTVPCKLVQIGSVYI